MFNMALKLVGTNTSEQFHKYLDPIIYFENEDKKEGFFTEVNISILIILI